MPINPIIDPEQFIWQPNLPPIGITKADMDKMLAEQAFTPKPTLKKTPLKVTPAKKVPWQPNLPPIGITWADMDKMLAEQAFTPKPPLKKTPLKVTPAKEVPMKDRVIGKMYKYNPLSKYIGFEGKKEVRAGTTFVGLEIELEKVQTKSDILGTWNVVDDNSLKDQGREFVTIPIQFKFLEVELNRLFSGLSSCHASDRCSVHVHLNVRDFTIEELKTFIALYMIFEKSLYNFSGNRWNNNFCVPVSFYPNPAKEMIDYLSNGLVSHNWYKYYGFNMSPIFGGESSKIGTVEFRHMKGTTDPAYIIDWVNLIVSLKITAKKMDYNVLMDHLKTMNTTSGYYWLADHTFKDFKGLIINQPTFKQDVEFCIAKAKSVFIKDDYSAEETIKIITTDRGTECADLFL